MPNLHNHRALYSSKTSYKFLRVCFIIEDDNQQLMLEHSSQLQMHENNYCKIRTVQIYVI